MSSNQPPTPDGPYFTPRIHLETSFYHHHVYILAPLLPRPSLHLRLQVLLSKFRFLHNCDMKALSLLSMVAIGAFACDSCYGPHDDAVHARKVRRMQPEAQSAHTKPRGPLEWGQLNFLPTTDAHGWLEGFVDLCCCIFFAGS